MNRRSFLKGLGAVLIGLQAPLALADSKLRALALRDPRTWRERLPFPTTLEELAPAIERLFPGEVLTSARAYEEFIPGTNVPLTFDANGFGMASIKDEGAAILYSLPDDNVTRCVHKTFALGYFVQRDASDNERLERTIIRCHYQTMLIISQRSENQGATLIWRKKPFATTFRSDPDWLKSDEPDVSKRFVRMRLSLKQNGWRERLAVAPSLDAESLKAEGAQSLMIGT